MSWSSSSLFFYLIIIKLSLPSCYFCHHHHQPNIILFNLSLLWEVSVLSIMWGGGACLSRSIHFYHNLAGVPKTKCCNARQFFNNQSFQIVLFLSSAKKTMTSLKCTIVLLVFLLAHLDLELVQCFSYTVTKCPPRPYFCGLPEYSCSNDQECEVSHPGKGFKCCESCGRRCVSPIELVVEVLSPEKLLKNLTVLTKMVAKCPTNPPSSTSPPGPDEECQNDASCDSKFPGEGLKCCSDACGFRCIPPIVESVRERIEGYCPLTPPSTICYEDDYFRRNCNTDADCEQKYPALKAFVKCCSTKCASQMCMIAIPGKAPPPSRRRCPPYPPPSECPPEPDDECQHDKLCNMKYPGLGLRCCQEGCETRCLKPVFWIEQEWTFIIFFSNIDECPLEIEML